MIRTFTIPEFAARVGVQRETIYRWIRAGRVKAFKIGGAGHFRIPETELPELIRQGEYETNAQRLKRVEKILAMINE
jgi:excisionase family DNA binding protein